jgi:hypothetical protein
MPLSAGHANNIVDASNGTAAFVATTTPVKQLLMTTNGTGTTNGTELATGGGYTAGTGQNITFAASAVVSAEAKAASNVAVTYTNMPAATIVGIELWDSALTPVRKWYGAHASKTVAAGDTLSYASGAVTDAVGI